MIILRDSTSDWWVFSIIYNINITKYVKYIYIYLHKHIFTRSQQARFFGPPLKKNSKNHLFASLCEALDQQSFPLRFVWPRGFGYRECREGRVGMALDIWKTLENGPGLLKMCVSIIEHGGYSSLLCWCTSRSSLDWMIFKEKSCRIMHHAVTPSLTWRAFSNATSCPKPLGQSAKNAAFDLYETSRVRWKWTDGRQSGFTRGKSVSVLNVRFF